MLEFWDLVLGSCQFMSPSLWYDFFPTLVQKEHLFHFSYFSPLWFYDADGTKDILWWSWGIISWMVRSHWNVSAWCMQEQACLKERNSDEVQADWGSRGGGEPFRVVWKRRGIRSNRSWRLHFVGCCRLHYISCFLLIRCEMQATTMHDIWTTLES